MNRETRDKFASGTQADVTSGNACWETPPLVFAKLNKDFGPFDIDLTADLGRRMCNVYFGPDHDYLPYRDALTANWVGTCNVNGYSNPPYGPFVQRLLWKAKQETQGGFSTTLLLPMRVTKAFKAHVLNGASDLLFCDSRIVFFEHGEPRWNAKALADGRYVPDPAMFDSIIVRYTPGDWSKGPRVGLWHVPEHVSAAIALKAA